MEDTAGNTADLEMLDDQTGQDTDCREMNSQTDPGRMGVQAGQDMPFSMEKGLLMEERELIR